MEIQPEVRPLWAGDTGSEPAVSGGSLGSMREWGQLGPGTEFQEEDAGVEAKSLGLLVPEGGSPSMLKDLKGPCLCFLCSGTKTRVHLWGLLLSP